MAAALVSGGAGFIGGRLTEARLARPCRVLVVDSRPVGGVRPADQGAEVIQGDVRDADTWARALVGVDVIFHLAAAVGAHTDARRYLDVNSRPCRRLDL